MTYAPNPLPLLIKNRHRADPELLEAVFGPIKRLIEFVRPSMEYYESLGIRIPTPLEKECQRAVRAYFDAHALDFRPTWPNIMGHTGQTGPRS